MIKQLMTARRAEDVKQAFKQMLLGMHGYYPVEGLFFIKTENIDSSYTNSYAEWDISTGIQWFSIVSITGNSAFVIMYKVPRIQDWTVRPRRDSDIHILKELFGPKKVEGATIV